MRKRLLSIIGIGLMGMQIGYAQKAAIKTNLLHDATATLNLGIEVLLNPKWTLDVSADYNPWTFSDNKKWKQWRLQPEARYWFCEAFNRHFIGGHLLGGGYNAGNVNLNFKMLGTDFRKLKENRYDGWYAGAGFVYGYSWLLSKHWNLEGVFGVGYAYTRYDRYSCATCGEKQEKDKSHHYFGPTKVALNLVYAF